MLRVGLTGSIAVGKSFVSAVFAELGARVLDADLTARAVVAPGAEVLRKIVEKFGGEVLRSDGALDRQKLGAIIFADAAKRAELNALLHPLIIEAQDEWLRACEKDDPRGVAIIDAALMIESGSYKWFDKLVVVWCRPEIQLARLMRRDRLDEAAARQRIAVQMAQEEKKTFADYLIDTSEGFDAARRQTEAVYADLLSLAARASE